VLFFIASMSALTIRLYNNYDRLHISVWTSYRVQVGDTVYGLAERFDSGDDRWAVVREIESKNGMGSSVAIRAGQVIQVPVGRR